MNQTLSSPPLRRPARLPTGGRIRLIWTPALALAASLTSGAAANLEALEEPDPQQLTSRQSAMPFGILPIDPAVDEAHTARLIALLGDSSWQTRRRAQTQLIELGTPALKAIDDARRSSPDPQLHVALELVEEGIARRQAERGRLIFLALESAPAAAALREMARQAGVDVRPDEWSLSSLQLDGRFGGEGWWPALLQLCERYDLDVRLSGTSMSILRATTDGPRILGGPVSTDGPVIVMARGASYQRSVDLARMPRPRPGQQPASDNARRGTRFRYDFEALLEPRFQLGARRFDVVINHAQDDAGNLLLNNALADGADLGSPLGSPPTGSDGGFLNSITPANWANGRLRFEVDLQYPANPGQTIQLAGRIRGLAGADLYDLRVPASQLLAGSLWQVADEQLEGRLELSPSGRWVLVVQSTRAVTPEVADVISAGLGTAELLDAANARLRRGSFNSQVGDDGRVIVRVEFSAASEEGAPVRLQARLPRRAVELDVPFAFHDLPMP